MVRPNSFANTCFSSGLTKVDLFRLGMTDAIAPFLFGFIKIMIGVGNQFCGLNRLIDPINGDSQADGQRQIFAIVEQGRFGDGPANTFPDLAGGSQSGIWEDDGEFLPTVAAGDIEPPHILPQDRGDMSQRSVADLVSPGIVDLFKVIDVEHDQSGGLAATLGAFDFVFQGLDKKR